MNILTVYHSSDKDISCGHLALMITEALRAFEASAHISSLLYKAQPPGYPAKNIFLLISCHCGKKELKQNNYIYKASSVLNIFAFVVQ